ncbi:hypothetical protein [Candidatus Mesenet endosymbiont of Agriotes lineatus]|uniref:hypothetical protein n=1 Tax=Candidatus Mesenet endosymbiont of Agriotes lineatus TaxID=3077948 RepID=UPI0030D52552
MGEETKKLCDVQKEPAKTLCNNFNQLIDDSRKVYKSIDEKYKDHFSGILTLLDQEYHTFFKEVGITADAFIPALDNIYKKIDSLAKTDDLKSMVKINDLKGFIKKGDLDNLVTKGDLGIKNANFDLKQLAKKDDIKDLTKQINSPTNAPVNLDGLAKEQDLKSLAQEVNSIKTATSKIDKLAKTDDLEKLAKTDDLEKLAKTDDLEKLAKTDDLKDLAKTDDFATLNQQVADLVQKDETFYKATTDQIATVSQRTNTMSQEAKVKLVKGNEIAGKYEAEIQLADGSSKIGIFSPEGYYFYEGTIYVYDHLRPEISIDLPSQFHFLTVVKTEEGKYKLAFCNKGGESYYDVPNDHRLINPIDIKSIKNIDFEKYYNKNGSNPSFIAKMSSDSYPNPNSHQHGVDVYEIGDGGKEIGSLIDEFGYYDSQGKFHYSNNYIDAQDHSYDSLLFTINKGQDNKCSLHKMHEGTGDIDLASDTATCSLVEYVANYVNGVYF